MWNFLDEESAHYFQFFNHLKEKKTFFESSFLKKAEKTAFESQIAKKKFDGGSRLPYKPKFRYELDESQTSKPQALL